MNKRSTDIFEPTISMHMEIREKQFQNTKMTENLNLVWVQICWISTISSYIQLRMNYTLRSFNLFCLIKIKYKLSFIELCLLFIGNHSPISKKLLYEFLHSCPKWEINMIEDLVKVQWPEQLTQLCDSALWNSSGLAGQPLLSWNQRSWWDPHNMVPINVSLWKGWLTG